MQGMFIYCQFIWNTRVTRHCTLRKRWLPSCSWSCWPRCQLEGKRLPLTCTVVLHSSVPTLSVLGLPFFLVWVGVGSGVRFQVTVSITSNWLCLNPLVMEKSIPDTHQNRLQPMGIQNVRQSERSATTDKSFWWQSEEEDAEGRQETLWSWGGSSLGRTTLGWGHPRRTAAMSGYALVGLWPWVTHSKAGRTLKDCVHWQPKLGHWEVEAAEENHEDRRSGGKPEFRRRKSFHICCWPSVLEMREWTQYNPQKNEGSCDFTERW